MMLKQLMALVTFSFISVTSYADPQFRIDNNTNYDLSFAIDHACSQEFGNIIGGSYTLIPLTSFSKACQSDPHSCQAYIYTGANCSGDSIAKVIFDTDFGVKQVINSGNYTFTWGLYSLIISQRID